MGAKETGSETARPAQSGGAGPQTPEVIVLYTDEAATAGALGTALELGRGTGVRIRVVRLEVVPYGRLLEEPARSLAHLERECAQVVAGRAEAEILLCRDGWAALEGRLRKESVVVIGRRGWWWRREDWLARRLARAGHHVIRTAARGAAHV